MRIEIRAETQVEIGPSHSTSAALPRAAHAKADPRQCFESERFGYLPNSIARDPTISPAELVICAELATRVSWRLVVGKLIKLVRQPKKGGESRLGGSRRSIGDALASVRRRGIVTGHELRETGTRPTRSGGASAARLESPRDARHRFAPLPKERLRTVEGDGHSVVQGAWLDGSLTVRQAAILVYINAGVENGPYAYTDEIAERFSLSVDTVREELRALRDVHIREDTPRQKGRYRGVRYTTMPASEPTQRQTEIVASEPTQPHTAPTAHGFNGILTHYSSDALASSHESPPPPKGERGEGSPSAPSEVRTRQRRRRHVDVYGRPAQNRERIDEKGRRQHTYGLDEPIGCQTITRDHLKAALATARQRLPEVEPEHSRAGAEIVRRRHVHRRQVRIDQIEYEIAREAVYACRPELREADRRQREAEVAVREKAEAERRAADELRRRRERYAKELRDLEGLSPDEVCARRTRNASEAARWFVSSHPHAAEWVREYSEQGDLIDWLHAPCDANSPHAGTEA